MAATHTTLTISKERALRGLNYLDVGTSIRGIFSDWATTVSFYANCMGLK